LSDWGLLEEAARFRNARGTGNIYDRQSYNYGTLQARIVILEVVRDDLTSHPDFYTQRPKSIPSEPSQAAPKEAVRHDKIFLGHGRSLLWTRVERWLDKDKGVAVQAWEAESHAGEHVIQVLQSLLDSSTFAVLVVTGEDATANGTIRARQNVIHEIGLFQGKLGFKKVALLEQDATESFSNIDGLQTIRFPDERIEAAFPELERMLKREGVLK
jgi:predicted nucleotide-binding protein